jgi:glycosyltransferase involved in cell wall biosynthesis
MEKRELPGVFFSRMVDRELRPLPRQKEYSLNSEILWSVVIPTRCRAQTLFRCLQSLEVSDLPIVFSEILIYDNGAPDDSRSVVLTFIDRLPIRYTINEPGHGFGYSVVKGAADSRGLYVLELNDDALIPPNFFQRMQSTFESDATVGIIGVRADEEGYQLLGDGVGWIDGRTCEVVANFSIPTEGIREVEHVYGFCFAFRKSLVEMGCGHDVVLLSRDYSSGNRIETDQCLSARSAGFRVVYDGTLQVKHLAQPRTDLDEKSSRWRINYTRNTLYLYLKHFGVFGRNAIATRFCLYKNTGLKSLLLRPSLSNLQYFYDAMWSRGSAFYHWGIYLLTSKRRVLFWPRKQG